MLRTARMLLGAAPRLADEADALAIAVCHLARRGAAPGAGGRCAPEAMRAALRARVAAARGAAPPGAPRPPGRRVIARLSGKLAEKAADHAIVDVGGVGYLVHLSAASLAALPPPGGAVALRTYTHVRQDALELYGFATEDEESVFRALIDVKGVGPRAAQNILSGIEARELARAIAEGDVARLTKVPGIGKKTAERLVVELKEKLARRSPARPGPSRPRPGADVLDQLRQRAREPRLQAAAGRRRRRRAPRGRGREDARRAPARGAEAAPRHRRRPRALASAAR